MANDIQMKLVEALKEKGLKAATAESLTGGLISKRITEISASSVVFECGICSYSNRIKHDILGVPNDILEKYTEYSSETAVAMAEGVRRLSGADIGISTTGIAGPNGGTPEKPVGLVYVGISTKNHSFAKELHLSQNLPDEREKIRFEASSYALYYALNQLINEAKIINIEEDN